jgi:hypothetical protein
MACGYKDLGFEASGARYAAWSPTMNVVFVLMDLEAYGLKDSCLQAFRK